MTDKKPRIAIVGGTGALGSGLAFRWARAGYAIIIGSRDTDKSIRAVAALSTRLPQADLSGASNVDAASAGDIVVITVPYSSHEATLISIRDEVRGKIVVDTTVPLVPPKVSRVQLSPDWPVAKKAQSILGEETRVVSAFHNVAAAHLQLDSDDRDGDVLVYGNKNNAREQVIELVQATGYRGLHAGPIDNSVVSEALTSVLIFINKKYGIHGAGLKITGEPE